MRSTGEVMGIDTTFGLAFAKSQIAAGDRLPERGTVFLSLADRDKARRPSRPPAASSGSASRIAATGGTADALEAARRRRSRPSWPSSAIEDGHDAVDLIEAGKIAPGREQPAGPRAPGRRRATSAAPPACAGIPCLTTAAAGAGRRQRHGRLGRARAAGAAAPGVPRRAGTRSDDQLELSMPRRPGRRRSCGGPRRPAHPGRLGRAAEPGDDRVGHGRPRRRARAATSTSASLGAVVVKSLSAEPWAGNPAPRVHETAAGMLNSVGLQGPGVEAWLADELPPLLATGARVVASIWGRTVDDYERAADAAARTPRPTVVAVEVNLSCPNVEARADMFAHSRGGHRGGRWRPPRRAAGRAGPSSARTSPTWPRSPAPPARRGRGGHAGQHVLGMAIDPETRGYRLGNGGGGLSGPAIHPVAVRAVHDVHEALPELPIVGVGGVRQRRRRGRAAAGRRVARCRSARPPSPTPGPRAPGADGVGRLVPAPRRAATSAT